MLYFVDLTNNNLHALTMLVECSVCESSAQTLSQTDVICSRPIEELTSANIEMTQTVARFLRYS